MKAQATRPRGEEGRATRGQGRGAVTTAGGQFGLVLGSGTCHREERERDVGRSLSRTHTHNHHHGDKACGTAADRRTHAPGLSAPPQSQLARVLAMSLTPNPISLLLHPPSSLVPPSFLSFLPPAPPQPRLLPSLSGLWPVLPRRLSVSRTGMPSCRRRWISGCMGQLVPG